MLCVEDYLAGLWDWRNSVGGLKSLIARADANTQPPQDLWKTPRLDRISLAVFIGRTRSNTSVMPEVANDDRRSRRAQPSQKSFVAKRVWLDEGLCIDVGAYRDASCRFCAYLGGGTVEASDIPEAMLPWLEWAFSQALKSTPIAAPRSFFGGRVG